MALAHGEGIQVDGLAPTLEFLLSVQTCLSNGERVQVGMTAYAETARGDLADAVRMALVATRNGNSPAAAIRSLASPYRRAALNLAVRSLDGQSIQKPLAELLKETKEACELEIRAFVAVLPFRALIPLLLLQLPALLLVLLGPLIGNLVRSLQ